MRHLVYVLTNPERTESKIGYTYGRLSHRRCAARRKVENADFFAVFPDCDMEVEYLAINNFWVTLRVLDKNSQTVGGGDWLSGPPELAVNAVLLAIQCRRDRSYTPHFKTMYEAMKQHILEEQSAA